MQLGYITPSIPTAALVALAMLSPVAPAAAQSLRALDLTDAIEIARENSPEYLIQRNQLRAADWNVRTAYGNLLPSLNVSNSFSYTAEGERRLDDVRLSTQPATYSSRYGLNLSLQVNGSTLLAPAVARAEARAVAEQVEGITATLESEVVQRYLALVAAREQVIQAGREVARTDAYVRLAEARFEADTGTQLDVRRAEVQRGQAEIRLLQAQSTASNEVLLLSRLLGQRLPDDVELTERFTLFEPAWSVDELASLALRRNPSLRAHRAQVDASATRLRAARSNYLPTLSFSAGVSGFVSEVGLGTNTLVSQELAAQESRYVNCLEANQIRGVAGLSPQACTPPADEATVRSSLSNRGRFPFGYARQPLGASLTLSLPIFNGFNRELQVEEARVARSNAEYRLRSQELQLQVEIESGLRNLQTAYRSALLQQQVRQTAEEELRLAEERFRFGVTTSVEVVDAQASLSEAERSEIAAIHDFHGALAVLESQVGVPLAR